GLLGTKCKYFFKFCARWVIFSVGLSMIRRFSLGVKVGRCLYRFVASTLPSCDREYLPSHNRRIPVPKAPTTVGGHLRRRRPQLKIIQREAARRLQVSTVTLAAWERDTVYPTWPQQPKGTSPTQHALSQCGSYRTKLKRAFTG